MQRGKIFTAVAWGLGGLFLCAAAAVCVLLTAASFLLVRRFSRTAR